MSQTLLSAPTEPHQVVRRLIKQIRAGGLTVGDRLPSIRQLAIRLQVSSSVVRDALVQAQMMGLVKIRPRSGAYLQSVDYAPLVGALSETLEGALLQVDHNLLHLLEVRQLIETQCAEQAARRRQLSDLLPLRDALDEMEQALDALQSEGSIEARGRFVEADIRFHLGIAKVSGNPVLYTMLKALLGLLRPHLAQLPWSVERKQVTQSGHFELYEALLEGDAQRAREVVHRHLQVAYDGLLKRVWSKSDRSKPLPESAHGSNGHR